MTHFVHGLLKSLQLSVSVTGIFSLVTTQHKIIIPYNLDIKPAAMNLVHTEIMGTIV